MMEAALGLFRKLRNFPVLLSKARTQNIHTLNSLKLSVF
mgnify:CR=1 FL=1